MKHFIPLVLAGVMTAVSVTFSSHTVTAEAEHHDNVLIIYFSRAGENYNVGVVERGNTDLLAEIVWKENFRSKILSRQVFLPHCILQSLLRLRVSALSRLLWCLCR